MVWPRNDGGHRNRAADLDEGLGPAADGSRYARTKATLRDGRSGIELSEEWVEYRQGEVARPRLRDK